MEDLDDEVLRDQLDRSLSTADQEGRAERTLDAMLGEPQVLVALKEFGESVLYAIVKEDTVVTVLPQGHGEEILQRGRVLQERVAAGEVRQPEPVARTPEDRPERREPREGRRVPPWRRGEANESARPAASEGTGPVVRAPRPPITPADEEVGYRRRPPRLDTVADFRAFESLKRPADPTGGALFEALEAGREQAKVLALRELIADQGKDRLLLPAWESLFGSGVPANLTLGDLISACKNI